MIKLSYHEETDKPHSRIGVNECDSNNQLEGRTELVTPAEQLEFSLAERSITFLPDLFFWGGG